jgi:hypothetical protein
MSQSVCGHNDCDKPLHQPLLLCSRCKNVAYCSKECQVCPHHQVHVHAYLRVLNNILSTHILSRARPLQIKAWKGGHKRECATTDKVNDKVAQVPSDKVAEGGHKRECATTDKVNGKVAQVPSDKVADAPNNHNDKRAARPHQNRLKTKLRELAKARGGVNAQHAVAEEVATAPSVGKGFGLHAHVKATPDQLRLIRALDDIIQAQASILESMLYDIGFM